MKFIYGLKSAVGFFHRRALKLNPTKYSREYNNALTLIQYQAAFLAEELFIFIINVSIAAVRALPVQVLSL